MNIAIEQNILLLPPQLAREIGTNTALVLQQMHYWLQKSKHWIDGAKWIYNTFADWVKQFPFSLRTMKRVVSQLRELKLIRVEQFEKSHWDHTNWYTIDYERLEVLISSIVPNCPDHLCQPDTTDSANLAPSSTEITPETSTEKLEKTKKPKKKEPDGYEEWYQSALILGWVSARDGVKVRMAKGLYQGRYFNWKEVAKNQEHFLTEPVPHQPGQYLRALAKGFAKK